MRATALLALAAGLLLVEPVRPQAQTLGLDEVISRSIAARGGMERLAAVQTARVSGRMTMGPMEIPFTMEWRSPDRVRMSYTAQGQTAVRAFDGTSAWMLDPFRGGPDAEKMTERDTAGMAQEGDFLLGPLVDWQKKGHQVRLVGKTAVDGTPAYELEIKLKSGDVRHDFLDAETFLTILEASTHEEGDQVLEVETEVGNYRSVDGLMLPFRLESTMKGAPRGAGAQTVTVDTYELGGVIPDDHFTFPAATVAAPAAEPTEAPAADAAPAKPPGGG
jgi:outer membrane lipoprotein-sorting protein